MDVNPIPYEDMEVLEQEVYFMQSRSEWHQIDTVGMGTANLKGLNFQNSFHNCICILCGCGCNCETQASAGTKTCSLMSCPVLSSLDNQHFCFWILNALRESFSHPNVTSKCGSVTALLLRGPHFMCRAISRINASRSCVYFHSLPPEAAPFSC